ncbi:hypothetical protein U0070_008383 [Myodes glareolus]|uniref:Uncharacterized protein n=1 Tax=Myodes glareolus TaxID=447135 RepID=A0AAW0IXX6_MYOGA
MENYSSPSSYRKLEQLSDLTREVSVLRTAADRETYNHEQASDLSLDEGFILNLHKTPDILTVRGTGIVSAPMPKKLLIMTGPGDRYTSAAGGTSAVKVTFDAIFKTCSYLTLGLWKETVFTTSQEFTGHLRKIRVSVQSAQVPLQLWLPHKVHEALAGMNLDVTLGAARTSKAVPFALLQLLKPAGRSPHGGVQCTISTALHRVGVQCTISTAAHRVGVQCTVSTAAHRVGVQCTISTALHRVDIQCTVSTALHRAFEDIDTSTCPDAIYSIGWWQPPTSETCHNQTLKGCGIIEQGAASTSRRTHPPLPGDQIDVVS